MSVDQVQDYGPQLVAIVLGTGFSLVFLAMAMFVGPKRPGAEKLAPFECGSEPIGSPRVRFSVKFYQVAILFLVFDIEAAFLYPWAVNYNALSCKGPLAANGACTAGVSFFGLGGVVVFMGILVVALAYVWRKRAVGWE